MEYATRARVKLLQKFHCKNWPTPGDKHIFLVGAGYRRTTYEEEKDMNTKLKVYHTRGYKIIPDPERFLVTVTDDKEDVATPGDALPDWIFDSEYVMWIFESSESIRQRALAGEWVKSVLSCPQIKSIA